MEPGPAETHDYVRDWLEVPDNDEFDNGFKMQWEEFLRHVVADAPHRFDLLAGARGVQLAEVGLESSRTGARIDLPELDLAGAPTLMTSGPAMRTVAGSTPPARVRRLELTDRAGLPPPDRAAALPGRLRRRARRPAGAAENVPGAPADLDWDATLAFRHHSGPGASAWPTPWTPPSAAWAWTATATRELITRSAAEARAVGRRARGRA